MNTGLYPMTFEDGGTITFNAPAIHWGSYISNWFTLPRYWSHTTDHILFKQQVHKQSLSCQGSNTFESFLLYVVNQDSRCH